MKFKSTSLQPDDTTFNVQHSPFDVYKVQNVKEKKILYRKVKRGRGLPKASSNFSSVCILLWVVLIVLLAAADGASETVAGRSADPLLSKYLRSGRLTAENGLSNDRTWQLAQDKSSFMWFGTSDGLSRYDSASIKVYRHDPDDPNSLSHNIVRAMTADQNGFFLFDKIRRQQ